jgi:hypothetical protein
MKYKFSFLVILISLFLYINACDFFRGYSQSYVIIINRKIVGKELINEKTNYKGELICLSEQERDTYGSKKKERRIIRTKMIFHEGESFPVSYSYESSAGISYDLKVMDGQIIRTLQEEGQSREITTPLEPDMLLFDLNAFHTISYWVSKYDRDKGGLQFIQTYFLPSGSIEKFSVAPVSVNFKVHETMGLKLRNYRIEIGDQMTMLLWLDEDNRLFRMFIRGPNVEVIRSDLYDQIKKQKESENRRS